MKKFLYAYTPILVFVGLAGICLVGLLVVGAPLEPVYGATPAPLPPTFTSMSPMEYPVKPGLTIQALDWPGTSLRIEGMRKAKCAQKGGGIFAEEKLVVFYTTNNTVRSMILSQSLCISIGFEGDEKDPWIWIRSRMISGKQELFLVVPPGWQRVDH